MKKYFNVWKQFIKLTFSSYISNRIDSVAYFAGKIFRFLFFFTVIYGIFGHTRLLAGYTKHEAILFFLVYNIVDASAQAVFRGLYYFKDEVRKGNFDYILSKPVNSLFVVLIRQTDILDIIFLIPIFIITAFIVIKMKIYFTLMGLAAAIFLILASFVIVLGIHIIIAGATIWLTENENIIWLYRDAMTIGRFPPDILPNPVQLFFVIVVPVITINAFPTKALLGNISWQWIIFACVYAVVFFALSVLFWKQSLKKYSSASS